MTPTFCLFFLFGLVNNVLYVIILSAAVDLVGAATPKAVVLLANIVPSFSIKLAAPFFIDKVSYPIRILALVGLLVIGMVVISLSASVPPKIIGIILASLSLGVGEVTFLQLTHYYRGNSAVGGFSLGTGMAGLFGSGYYLFFTDICQFQSWVVLLASSVLPFLLLAVFHRLLPEGVAREDTPEVDAVWTHTAGIKDHIVATLKKIRKLVVPYMIPLALVYLFEYVINQGISPTLLFPLDEVPSWLIHNYRDMYVVYGFLYQVGVFISRLSINFGIRIPHLKIMAALQGVNVILCIMQLVLFSLPFPNIYLLALLMIYEGLLGGFAYVNTFVSVKEAGGEDVEFNMGAVTMSDSFGIVIAGLVSYIIEPKLCQWQVDQGRDWCRVD